MSAENMYLTLSLELTPFKQSLGNFQTIENTVIIEKKMPRLGMTIAYESEFVDIVKLMSEARK